MIRRWFSRAVSEETPKNAFIAVLRSLSERSGQYFWGLNALEDVSFGIHKLLDLQCHQTKKILKMLLYTGNKGEVSKDGMERLCNDIGRHLCQV
jgi:hypothetical protein